MRFMSKQQEGYMRVIYELIVKYGFATNKRIAQELNVAPASVTEMIRKLRKKNWVQVNNHQITFTDKGETYVKDVLSRHRLWETFLLTKLDYPPEDVHQLAVSLEHVSDEDLIQRLNRYLAYPKTCPHGGTIFLNTKENLDSENLWTYDQGIYWIDRILDEENYDHYHHRGLVPGADIQVDKKFSANMQVRLNGKAATLSRTEAENILVLKK